MTRDPVDNPTPAIPLESSSYRQGPNRKVRSSPYKRNGPRNEGKPGFQQQRNMQRSNNNNNGSSNKQHRSNTTSSSSSSAAAAVGVTGDGFKSARRFTGGLTTAEPRLPRTTSAYPNHFDHGDSADNNNKLHQQLSLDINDTVELDLHNDPNYMDEVDIDADDESIGGASSTTEQNMSMSSLENSSNASSFFASTEERRLEQRQKQIDYGKNTVGYDRYIRVVPKHKRKKGDPATPDKYLQCSKRCWDGLVRAWRRRLHDYDTREGEQDAKPAPILTGPIGGKSQQPANKAPILNALSPTFTSSAAAKIKTPLSPLPNRAFTSKSAPTTPEREGELLQQQSEILAEEEGCGSNQLTPTASRIQNYQMRLQPYRVQQHHELRQQHQQQQEQQQQQQQQRTEQEEMIDQLEEFERGIYDAGAQGEEIIYYGNEDDDLYEDSFDHQQQVGEDEQVQLQLQQQQYQSQQQQQLLLLQQQQQQQNDVSPTKEFVLPESNQVLFGSVSVHVSTPDRRLTIGSTGGASFGVGMDEDDDDMCEALESQMLTKLRFGGLAGCVSMDVEEGELAEEDCEEENLENVRSLHVNVAHTSSAPRIGGLVTSMKPSDMDTEMEEGEIMESDTPKKPSSSTSWSTVSRAKQDIKQKSSSRYANDSSSLSGPKVPKPITNVVAPRIAGPTFADMLKKKF